MVSITLNMTGEMALAGDARLRFGMSPNATGWLPGATGPKQAYIADVTTHLTRRLRGPS